MRLFLSFLLVFCFITVAEAVLCEGLEQYREYCNAINHGRGARGSDQIPFELGVKSGIIEGLFNCAAMESNTSGLGVDDSYTADYRFFAKVAGIVRETSAFFEEIILSVFSRYLVLTEAK